MNHIFIPTPVGHEICVTEFLPNNRPKAVIVLASAVGVKQTLYFKFSEYLKSHGFAVYTFDYAGIGYSRKAPLNGLDISASQWGANDLECVIQHAKRKNAAAELLIIGHSIGGQLIGLAPSNVLANGILLVAAQSGYWRLWKGAAKARMFMTWYLLVPVLTYIFGYFPGKKIGSSEDLPKQMVLEWRNWCCSPNYLFDHIPTADQGFKAIECPIYSYSSRDDGYAPKVAVDWLTSKYENAKTTRKHLVSEDSEAPVIGHFSFFKSDNESRIWSLFLRDLANMVSGNPEAAPSTRIQ